MAGTFVFKNDEERDVAISNAFNLLQCMLVQGFDYADLLPADGSSGTGVRAILKFMQQVNRIEQLAQTAATRALMTNEQVDELAVAIGQKLVDDPDNQLSAVDLAAVAQVVRAALGDTHFTVDPPTAG